MTSAQRVMTIPGQNSVYRQPGCRKTGFVTDLQIVALTLHQLAMPL
jgi:hypothetical protein